MLLFPRGLGVVVRSIKLSAQLHTGFFIKTGLM
jgi:hypothetical protein